MNSFRKQRTLAMMTGFERYTKKTRRAMFLEEMEQVVPWGKLCALVEPHYPKPGQGRRPKELEKMLRIYFLQQWFNLADPAVEEALYDSSTLRHFAGIDLGAEPVPDETTKKGKNWYFGMKAHVGVDSKTKIIHTAVATAANVSDVAILPDLLHGEETRVWGDGAYQGQTGVIRECAPGARDFTQRRCRYKGQIVDEVAWAKNRTKSKVRAKVEHVFQVMKLKFGFVKVRYRGLKKNAHRLFVTCALVNLFVSRRKLLALA
jgi:IS5 family transposase